MPNNLNSVKFQRTYHHGDLKRALLTAAEEIIAERGVDSFSLREAARRAGVSPAAPAHHFGDVRQLFTVLASEGFEDLAQRLEQASSAADRTTRIAGQGLAYVGFARERPGIFTLMWRTALLNCDHTLYRAAADRAFAALDRAVRGDSASSEGAGGVGPQHAPSVAAWSLVHGFARLLLDGAFGQSREEQDQACRQLLPAVMAHLTI